MNEEINEESCYDIFIDTEASEFLENTEKIKDSNKIEEAKIEKGSNLLKNLTLDAKNIEKYIDRQVTFTTLQENMESWQYYYDQIKDIPDYIKDIVDEL